MLNSSEHEIFSANNMMSILVWQHLLAQPCSTMFSKKEFANVSNLGFIGRTNFMLSGAEQEKCFITLGIYRQDKFHAQRS